MFDITEAVDAAHKKVGSVEATTSLLRMLQLLTQEITQWRTMGKSTEVVSAFLDELGFTPGVDYEKYTSTLDDRVVDFRWAPGGKITDLHTTLQTIRAVNPSLFASVPVKFSVNKLIEFPAVPGATAEPDSCPLPSTLWPERIENITRDRLTKLYKIISGILHFITGTCPYPWIKVDTLEGIRTFNGVPESLLPWLRDYIAGRGVTPSGDPVVSVAIPDLWVVEAASRLLPPGQFSVPWPAVSVKEEDIPQFTMFGPLLPDTRDPSFDPLDRNLNREINRPTASRVLMRYLRSCEDVPGVNVMQSGIAVQELINKANDGDHNALQGYLSNNPDVLCKIDVDARPVALAVTTNVFNSFFKVRALAAGSNPKFLWSYICGLYKRFLGSELNVGIEPHARVAFGSSIESWRNFCGSWSPVLEGQAMMKHNPAVTFVFFISPYRIRKAFEPSQQAPDIPAISVVLTPEDITMDSANQHLSSRHMSNADAPGVWYSMTHFGGGDDPSPSIRLSDSDRQDVLKLFRERYKPGESTHDVLKDSAVSFNPRLSGEGNVAAEMVSGIARILRVGCEECGVTMVPLSHPDTQLHTPNSIVSNVYSYVEDYDFGLRYEWVSDAEYTEVRNTIANEQLRYNNDCGSMVKKRLVAIYETNVPYSTIMTLLPSGSVSKIHDSIRDLAFTNLVAGQPDQRGYGSSAMRLSLFLRSSKLASAVRDECRGVSLEEFLELPSMLREPCSGDARGRQMAPWIDVALQSDNLSRTHVIISLERWAAEAALARHRYRLSLPLADVAQAARLQLGDSDRCVFVRHPGASSNSEVDRLVNQLITTRRSLCWTCDSDYATTSVQFGYGPLHAKYHRNNAYESVGRSYYTESPSSIKVNPSIIVHT